METILKSKLEEICNQLRHPMDKDRVEELEATIKRTWEDKLQQDMSTAEKNEFIRFFAQVGFLPKFKSYGVKYAAPFGYSLFDLKAGQGFSVQIHKQAKVEAFHVLSAKPGAILVLASLDEWAEHKNEFLDLWFERRAHESPLAHEVQAGDVAVVSDLSIVHTVIGCVLEEYATSSYDVVDRLHDQNAGKPTELPEVLEPVARLAPKQFSEGRLLTKTDGEWVVERADRNNIVALPHAGLTGRHLDIGVAPRVMETKITDITTIVALRGDLMVRHGDFDQVLPQGSTTSVPPNCAVEIHNVSPLDKATASVCSVATEIAIADLRQLVD